MKRISCLLLMIVFCRGLALSQETIVNHVEGAAFLNDNHLSNKETARLAAGDVLTTDDGRIEVLLDAGVFLRVDTHSSLSKIET